MISSQYFQAWSSIVYLLIPNVKKIEKSLNTFANIIDADEVLLFEKASFLVGTKNSFIMFLWKDWGLMVCDIGIVVVEHLSLWGN